MNSSLFRTVIGTLFLLLMLSGLHPAFAADSDNDGLEDPDDNCISVANGPLLGTCTKGDTLGETCMSDGECGTGGFCSMSQEDTYPPQGNTIGDACDCEGDFNCDGNVDATDVTLFLGSFGRNQFNNPCTNGSPCDGDFNCNANVDATDVTKFLEDFGRNQFNNQCPTCGGGAWCSYLLSPPESRYSLNGTWKFKTDPYGIGHTQEWYQSNYNDASWTDLDVPGNWNYLFRSSQIPDRETDYDDPAWYRTSFTPHYYTTNHTIVLHFGAVCYKTTVWLNGEEIGNHEGDFVAFEFDISDKVILGSENHLALYVETINRESEYTIPQAVGRYDYWIFSGIHRDVYLEYRNLVHVFDVFVKGEPVQTDSGSVQVDTRIINTGDNDQYVDVSITLHEKGQEAVLAAASESCLVPAQTIVDKSFDFILDGITPWHPDTPQLYECRVELSDTAETPFPENDMESYDPAEKVPPHADLTLVESENLDAVKTDFGIRKIEVQGTQILLNGEPIILTGINRHDEYPLVGRVYTDDMLLDDLRMMKQANINTLRTAHYPNDPRVFQFADQLGLLTFEELPCTSLNEDYLTNLQVRALALDHARRMVHRDKNHPSIIIWSPGNEYFGDYNVKSDFNSLIYQEFKSIDPTRLVTYARAQGDMAEDPDSDLLMFNLYYGWYGGVVDDLSTVLDEVHVQFPDKPIILSEYGAGAIKNERSLDTPETSSHYTEDYQTYHLKRYWEIMKSKNFMAGGCIWLYNDFISPLRKNIFSNQGSFLNPIPYHNLKGIVDRDRVPKNAYLTVMGIYGDQPLYDLTIQVINSNGDPVTNANISVTLQDGTWVGQQKTDAQGHTILWYIPPMEYTITASSGGASESTMVNLTGNETVVIQCDECPSLPTNFILIYTDDQGFGDVGVYGAADIATPNIDQLASEGIKFTNFYVPASVCTPSRAGLLTGCYPKRVGLHDGLCWPNDTYGLNPAETTIAELLKNENYATAIVGKWHLGRPDELMPTNHGFDTFYGIPYSNSMLPSHPYAPNLGGFPPLPLMRDTEIIDDGSASGNPEGVDQTTLTRKFTEESITFITESHAQEKPFFLYLAHAMPHYPNYSSDDFVGSSQRGNYGDSVQEVDWSVGQIMQTLEDLGIEESTLVIFTSDNGPWQAASQVDFYGMGGDGTTGSALPLRGWKAQSLEGGMRVPCIMRFPGTIPAGIQSDKLATALDLLPTIAAYSGTTASLPTDRIIDGYDISAFLQNPDFIDTPNQYFFYYGLTNLEAVRDAEGYKLRTREETPELYFLPDDIHEDNNIADLYPDKVAELMAVMDAFDVEITQNARERGEAE